MSGTEIKAGDVVKCIEHVKFIDGTEHKHGQVIQVTELTRAYFNIQCNRNKYEKINYELA